MVFYYIALRVIDDFESYCQRTQKHIHKPQLQLTAFNNAANRQSLNPCRKLCAKGNINSMQMPHLSSEISLTNRKNKPGKM